MRTLIYVPIIHSTADMGSLADVSVRSGFFDSGHNLWQKHSDTINGYWQAIESYFDYADFSGRETKIFQDGMFADGEMATKIINEGIRAGSKNSEIVARLIVKGARLIQTEDFKMVKDEYDAIQYIMKSKNAFAKIYHLLRYKALKPVLLSKRDRYISHRIAQTLGTNETGILFIGAYHYIINLLPDDISVIQLKQIEKIRKYQKAVRRTSKMKRPKFDKLAEYLVEKI